MRSVGFAPIKIDIKELEDIIISTNELRQVAKTANEVIAAEVDRFSKDESLSGGSGPEIQEAYMQIGKAMDNLAKSCESCGTLADTRLSMAVRELKKDSKNEAKTRSTKAASATGVYKKE